MSLGKINAVKAISLFSLILCFQQSFADSSKTDVDRYELYLKKIRLAKKQGRFHTIYAYRIPITTAYVPLTEFGGYDENASTTDDIIEDLVENRISSVDQMIPTGETEAYLAQCETPEGEVPTMENCPSMEEPYMRNFEKENLDRIIREVYEKKEEFLAKDANKDIVPYYTSPIYFRRNIECVGTKKFRKQEESLKINAGQVFKRQRAVMVSTNNKRLDVEPAEETETTQTTMAVDQGDVVQDRKSVDGGKLELKYLEEDHKCIRFRMYVRAEIYISPDPIKLGAQKMAEFFFKKSRSKIVDEIEKLINPLTAFISGVAKNQFILPASPELSVLNGANRDLIYGRGSNIHPIFKNKIPVEGKQALFNHSLKKVIGPLYWNQLFADPQEETIGNFTGQFWDIQYAVEMMRAMGDVVRKDLNRLQTLLTEYNNYFGTDEFSNQSSDPIHLKYDVLAGYLGNLLLENQNLKFGIGIDFNAVTILTIQETRDFFNYLGAETNKGGEYVPFSYAPIGHHKNRGPKLFLDDDVWQTHIDCYQGDLGACAMYDLRALYGVRI